MRKWKLTTWLEGLALYVRQVSERLIEGLDGFEVGEVIRVHPADGSPSYLATVLVPPPPLHLGDSPRALTAAPCCPSCYRFHGQLHHVGDVREVALSRVARVTRRTDANARAS